MQLTRPAAQRLSWKNRMLSHYEISTLLLV
jgi:hypothetical protein